MKKTFLVRISNKSYCTWTQYEHYEIVEAFDNFGARHKALEIWEERLKYEPSVRRKFFESNLPKSLVCAGDSVEI